MAEQSIGNPAGLGTPLSTTLVGRYQDGTIVTLGNDSDVYIQANAAIAKGEVVGFNTTQTAGTPIQAVKQAVASDPRLMLGIAVNACAANGVCQVRTQGVVELFVNAQTVAYGDVVLKPGTNAGEATCSATDPAAADIVGTVLGTVLAVKTASNLALAYIKQV
jgi:hypothetical protein